MKRGNPHLQDGTTGVRGLIMRKRQGKKEYATIILAAGKGTRMKSDLAKVLHPVCGRPMLDHVVAVAREIGSLKIGVIIGHQADHIQETYKDQGLTFILQKEQLGTGHAVLQARQAFSSFQGTLIILCGDVPLLRPSTVRKMVEHHSKTHSVITVLTIRLDEPASYGRVVRGRDGRILKIVEARDATESEKDITEINTGIYCAESPFLFEAVAQIRNDNAQGEYYLTDICEIANQKGMKVTPFLTEDSVEVMGINTFGDLERARKVLERRISQPLNGLDD
jgi:UDP-N-acetylglucosamine diphosphorylase/glucosamine-1-phosphate N-acetyltransferase